jgi:DNA-binding response OmpR family regulator
MGNKKILIVDDDPDICQGMHVRLKANHYDTFFASDALTSMVEARKHEPDLIILDLGLPAGDGYVVMERLKKFPALAVIPIIVVSARDAHANRERAVKAGRRLFCKNPWMTPNFWRWFGKPWVNPPSGLDLTCMTWDPCSQKQLLRAAY